MTPGRSAIWGDVQATLNPKDADFFVVFGRVPAPDECPKERTIIIGREPRYWSGHTDLRGLDGYYGVYWYDMDSSFLPVLWGVPYDYDQLTALNDPQPKTKEISTIVSDKNFMSGHQYRLDFLREFSHRYPIDVYGRGGLMMPPTVPPTVRILGYIEDKSLSMVDYQFSIGMENCQSPGYFSGKLIDIILLWGIPIYWGAPDIYRYFAVIESIHAPGAIINVEHTIPIPDAVGKVIDTINLIENDDAVRQAVLEKVAEARQLILNRYQFWPVIEHIIKYKEFPK